MNVEFTDEASKMMITFEKNACERILEELHNKTGIQSALSILGTCFNAILSNNDIEDNAVHELFDDMKAHYFKSKNLIDRLNKKDKK